MSSGLSVLASGCILTPRAKCVSQTLDLVMEELVETTEKLVEESEAVTVEEEEFSDFDFSDTEEPEVEIPAPPTPKVELVKPLYPKLSFDVPKDRVFDISYITCNTVNHKTVVKSKGQRIDVSLVHGAIVSGVTRHFFKKSDFNIRYLMAPLDGNVSILCGGYDITPIFRTRVPEILFKDDGTPVYPNITPKRAATIQKKVWDVLVDTFTIKKMEPRSHQTQFVKQFEDWDGKSSHDPHLRYAAMGAGKTFESILLAFQKETSDVIVVCSSTMLDYWLEKVQENPHMFEGVSTFHIFNYGKFVSEAEEHVSRDTWLIVDESQHYRNATVNMRYATQWFLRSCFTLYLTGTPVQNDPSEFHVLMEMLGVDQQISGVSNEKLCSVLKGRISFYDPRYHDPDFKDKYPSMSKTVIRVPMKWCQTLDYLRQAFGRKNPLRIGGYIVSPPKGDSYNSLTNKLCNVSEGGEAAPKLLAIAEKTVSDKKGVVFSKYLDSGCRAVQDMISQKRGRESTDIITGDTPQPKRIKIIKAFNDDDLQKTLLFSQAAREGIDLKGVTDVHLVDPAGNLQDEGQIMARAIRYNSHAHLPPDQRHVNVNSYVSVFPTEDPTDKDLADTCRVFHRLVNGDIDLEKKFPYPRRANEWDKKDVNTLRAEYWDELGVVYFDIIGQIRAEVLRVGSKTSNELAIEKNAAKQIELQPYIDMLQICGSG
jgi:hypothetical protein